VQLGAVTRWRRREKLRIVRGNITSLLMTPKRKWMAAAFTAVIVGVGCLLLRSHSYPRIELLLEEGQEDEQVIAAEAATFSEGEVNRLVDVVNKQSREEREGWFSRKFPDWYARLKERWDPDHSESYRRTHRALRALQLLCWVRTPPHHWDKLPEQHQWVAGWSMIQTIVATGEKQEMSRLVRWVEDPAFQMDGVPASGPVFDIPRITIVAGIMSALRKAPPEMLAPLMGAIPSRKPPTGAQWNALRALRQYGTNAGDAAPLLRTLMNESKPNLDAAAALACVSPKNAPEAVAYTMARLLTKGGEHRILWPKVAAAAGPAAEPLAPKLESRLAESTYPEEAASCAEALWRIRHRATPRMIDALTVELKGGELYDPKRALLVLGEIGPAASNAAPAVEAFRTNRWLLLRQIATNTLQAIRQTPKAQ
jgi:hypothetical protein